MRDFMSAVRGAGAAGGKCEHSVVQQLSTVPFFLAQNCRLGLNKNAKTQQRKNAKTQKRKNAKTQKRENAKNKNYKQQYCRTLRLSAAKPS